jgi:hypothetical protein
MPLTSSQEWTNCGGTAVQFATESTLLPPRISGHSHSIVPGGFDVTS